MKSMIPNKLKNDAIVEASCLLHFESKHLPEIIIGRLSDSDLWSNYTMTRLAVSEIPASIRNADNNLKYTPLIQLKSLDNIWLIQVGSNVISFHIINHYCGWESFQSTLEQAINELFSKLNDIEITRIGLRYINGLSSESHYVKNINSLNININAANLKIEEAVNLNFSVHNDELHSTLTRIATPEFVKGDMPQNVTVTVDIDVHTPRSIKIIEKEKVFDWLNKAHDFEKNTFFSLLPEEIKDKLKEN